MYTKFKTLQNYGEKMDKELLFIAFMNIHGRHEYIQDLF
jgi:hypothetical protein